MTTMLFWKFRLSCLPRLAEDLQSADGIGPKRMDPAKDWTPDQLAKFLQPLLPRHPAMLLILVPAQAWYFQPWFHMLHRTCFWQNALELTVWRACGQVLSSQSVLVKLTQRLRPVSGWLSAWHMNRGDPSLESLPCSRLSSTWRLEILMMFWPCSYWHRIPKFSCLQKLGCWERCWEVTYKRIEVQSNSQIAHFHKMFHKLVCLSHKLSQVYVSHLKPEVTITPGSVDQISLVFWILKELELSDVRVGAQEWPRNAEKKCIRGRFYESFGRISEDSLQGAPGGSSTWSGQTRAIARIHSFFTSFCSTTRHRGITISCSVLQGVETAAQVLLECCDEETTLLTGGGLA